MCPTRCSSPISTNPPSPPSLPVSPVLSRQRSPSLIDISDSDEGFSPVPNCKRRLFAPLEASVSWTSPESLSSSASLYTVPEAVSPELPAGTRAGPEHTLDLSPLSPGSSERKEAFVAELVRGRMAPYLPVLLDQHSSVFRPDSAPGSSPVVVEELVTAVPAAAPRKRRAQKKISCLVLHHQLF